MLDIPLEKKWKTNLGQYFGVNLQKISTAISRDKISKNLMATIAEKGFPPEKWLMEEKPYPAAPEDIGIPRQSAQRDSDAGSYGIPDLNGHRVVRVIEPDEQQYLNMVAEIFQSGETGTIAALKSNIRQFKEQINDKKIIRSLIEQINRMKGGPETGEAQATHRPGPPDKKKAGQEGER